jgi:hypothetical protein
VLVPGKKNDDKLLVGLKGSLAMKTRIVEDGNKRSPNRRTTTDRSLQLL